MSAPGIAWVSPGPGGHNDGVAACFALVGAVAVFVNLGVAMFKPGWF